MEWSLTLGAKLHARTFRHERHLEMVAHRFLRFAFEADVFRRQFHERGATSFGPGAGSDHVA